MVKCSVLNSMIAIPEVSAQELIKSPSVRFNKDASSQSVRLDELPTPAGPDCADISIIETENKKSIKMGLKKAFIIEFIMGVKLDIFIYIFNDNHIVINLITIGLLRKFYAKGFMNKKIFLCFGSW